MIDKGDDRGKTLRVISEDRDHLVCIDQENPTQTLLYEKVNVFTYRNRTSIHYCQQSRKALKTGSML